MCHIKFLNPIFLITLIVLSSCSGPREEKRQKRWMTDDRGDDKTSDIPTPPKEKPPLEVPPSIPENKPSPPNLQGLWNTDCVDAADIEKGETGSKKTQRTQVQFHSSQATFVTDLYARGACDGRTHTIYVYTNYSTSAGATYPQIDLTLIKIELAPRTRDKADEMNDVEGGFCGIQNWKVNEPRDITGKKCYENQAASPSANHKIYDIYNVEQGLLKFGLSSLTTDQSGLSPTENGSAPDRRPKSLNQKLVFKRSAAP